MFSDSKCEDVRSCSCWSGLHLGKLQFRKSMVDGNIILIKHLNTLGQKTAGGTDRSKIAFYNKVGLLKTMLYRT